MSIRLPDFSFSNGTLGAGRFKTKQVDAHLLKMTEHAWEVNGRTVYVYMSGDIPPNELDGAKSFAAGQAATWKE
jgi:hypothetical protein